MELREIETFLAIVEYGTFSRAAEHLGYSQSAVTVQVRQLERELGVRLFDRVPRGAVLTEQGKAFAFHANEIAGAVRAARRAVVAPAEGARELTGVIRLGSAESISTALLPELLIAFHERCPKVQVVVSAARREHMVEGLRNNTLDLLLTMERRVCEPGIHVEALRREQVVFAVAPELAEGLGPSKAPDQGDSVSERGDSSPGRGDSAPVASRGSSGIRSDAAGGMGLCSPEILVGLPFVLTERGESYRLELDRLLAERDLAITPLVEAGNTETLVHLAERGVGATFVPRFSAARELECGALVELMCDLPAIEMESQLLWHGRKWLAPHLVEFIEATREFFGAER